MLSILISWVPKGGLGMKCTVKGINVNYEVFGEGRPIVMLHGFYPDHRLMTGCMEPIFKTREGHMRIYPDLPGMGLTKGEDWIENSDMMLDIVIEFIERIIPGQNFILAGESYGGYLSRGIIYRMADRVDGVLMICPMIIADREKRNIPPHRVLIKDSELLSKLNPNDVEEFASIAVVQDKRNYDRFEEEVQCGLKLADEKFLTNIYNNGYSFSFDPDNMGFKFEKPSLILLGRQDASVGYKDAWNILDNYPRASFAVLDMAGHNLQIEQDILFNSLVEEWLDRLED